MNIIIIEVLISTIIGYIFSEISKNYTDYDLPEIHFYILLFLLPLFIFLLEILNKQYLGYYEFPEFTTNFSDIFTNRIAIKIAGLILGSFIDKIIKID